MYIDVFYGLALPFAGTALGSMCVLFMKKSMDARLQKALSGFAAGVMVAASVWSLLIPALEQAADEGMGRLSFVPAVVGFCLGMVFLLLLDMATPHMHIDETVEGPRTNLGKSTMMFLAVTIHNIPEGMAVGVLYAGMMQGNSRISSSAALALAIGIAVQNFPEGAIISMPLHSKGLSKSKSMWLGMASGVVEPVAGIVTILLSAMLVPVLPYLLGFAAGAMIYVVIEELVPEMSEGTHSNASTLMFMAGFSIMMVLDVALS